MRIYRWAVALLCALLLAALAASASANHLSLNEQRFRTVYAPFEMAPSFGATTRCPLTLEGSFHSRTISKVSRSLIGYVARVSVGVCEAGRMRANTETLPWRRTYTGFITNLPNITAVIGLVIGLSVEIQGEIFGVRVICRYTSPEEPFFYERETARGVLTTERPETSSTTSETEGCPNVRFEGIARVTTPTGGTIVVTLI